MKLEIKVMDQFVNEEGSSQEKDCWRKIRSAMCEADSNAVLAEVSSVDEARDYLLALCRYKFKDKTFESYILNRLAGDFAVEIVNVFIRERNALNLR